MTDPALSLAAGNLTAAFVPGRGMLCASLRHRGEEILRRVDDRDGIPTGAEKAFEGCDGPLGDAAFDDGCALLSGGTVDFPAQTPCETPPEESGSCP